MLSDGYAINLKSVMLRYEDGSKALKNITIGLTSPSFQYLTGTSCSGKSSILKLMNLDILPTAGSLIIFGKDVSEMTDDEIAEAKSKISLISQGMHLIDSLTILENVALPLKIDGISKQKREQQAMEILDWLAVGKYSRNYPCELSCGERQCVAIARAIVRKPKILLADDPICYLDARMANKVISLFYELSKLDSCVVITNNNDLRIPPMFKEGREIKINNGMLIDNIIGRNKTNAFPMAI